MHILHSTDEMSEQGKLLTFQEILIEVDEAGSALISSISLVANWLLASSSSISSSSSGLLDDGRVLIGAETGEGGEKPSGFSALTKNT